VFQPPARPHPKVGDWGPRRLQVNDRRTKASFPTKRPVSVNPIRRLLRRRIVTDIRSLSQIQETNPQVRTCMA